MPSGMWPDVAPHWREFLAAVDTALTGEVRVHCLGGFAITMLYQFPRPTSDIDYIETVPGDAAAMLQAIAGRNSDLCKEHGLYFQQVAGIASLPESYNDRLIEVAPGAFQHLRLFALEPHDLALSKLARNSPIDQGDVEFLAKTVPLDPDILRDRYEREFRPCALGDPDWNDQTLKLWLETFFDI
jgi:uncharacterized nucleotidyltransferase DUF6036